MNDLSYPAVQFSFPFQGTLSDLLENMRQYLKRRRFFKSLA